MSSNAWFASWEAYYVGSNNLTLSISGSDVFSISSELNAKEAHDLILQSLKDKDRRYIYVLKSFNKL